ncbi:MAG: hypothetical protein M4579_005370 [Chaenotheca gracillima]|nr:MAG: hypothetical protein M4579_005370 [Chaenotheca gracillima]
MPKFVPRQRKHKKLQRSRSSDGVLSQKVENSNVEELVPASRAEKEEKRRRLREELRAQQPKISSKKQKRLDKYIDTKLKKEENLDLIKKLAKEKVDTSLLRSSRNLGATKESKREILSRALRERQSGIDIQGNDAILLEKREVPDIDDASESNGSNSQDVSPHLDVSGALKQARASSTLGSGLKRPLEVDGNGLPTLKKRRPLDIKNAEISQSEDSPWEGFESSSDEEVNGSGIPRGEDGGIGLLLDDDQSSVSSDASDKSSETDDSESSPESSSEYSEGNVELRNAQKQRASAFKAWANQQRNEAIGHQPFYESAMPETSSISFTPRAPEHDPLPAELRTTSSTRKAFNVQIHRTPEIEAARIALPVVAEEQKIMEAIYNNSVVVIWGATGSGKTTQIPQFLYEAGYGNPDSSTPGMIGVTQPRRVAAVSMARRVGDELGEDSGRVAYKIRFEGNVNERTSIKFMTDGILLREASEDITLRKYSAIIIDEAHERSKDTDILIGMMSRIVKLRYDLAKEDSSISPLKLVIMSATLKISDFTDNKQLFDLPPPLVQAEGRQHAVTMHWARRTASDYVEEAYRKITRGHRKLPQGGMLVFLTGQNEISHLSKRLNGSFTNKAAVSDRRAPKVQISGQEAPLEAEEMDLGSLRAERNDDSDKDEETRIVGLEEESEDDEEFKIEEDQQALDADAPIYLLPLYSLLPTKEQLRVFETVPENCRLVVLATNIAETSLTIPGIRYVIDCGRSKERRYDEETGVQSFEIDWISKANANQRAGRAGRTGPGHCYRLYSSAVYERDFEDYAKPEILRTPIEGIVLQLSGLNVPNIINRFPFPTQPDKVRLEKAQKLLTYLGALTTSNEITDFGRKMSNYPLFPRFAKVLLTGHKFSCLPYTIALVAALSIPQLFIPEAHINPSSKDQKPGQSEGILTFADRQAEDAKDKLRGEYKKAQYRFTQLSDTSDAIKLLSAVLAYASASDSDTFSSENFLRAKAMREAHLLRRQLTNLFRVDPDFSGAVGQFEGVLPNPSDKQTRYLKQVVASGYIDQVAIRADVAPSPPEQLRKPKRATDVQYLTLFPSQYHREADHAVYIHPSSVLSYRSVADAPQYIIYSHLQRSAGSSKIRMHPLTPIFGAQLAALARDTPLLSYSKPIKQVAVKETEDGKREVWVVPTLRGSSGGQGWPLPAEKIVQKRFKGVWLRES